MNATNTRARAGIFLLAGFAMFGAACGGGSDSPTTPLGTSIAEVEYESFQLVNSARRDSDVDPLLDLDQEIVELARRHSETMRDHGFFGHEGPNGGLRDRLVAAGVQFSAAGENLAKLTSVPDPASRAHSQFLNSAEHRHVMLDERFRLAGVGVARSGETYWLTQIYIKP